MKVLIIDNFDSFTFNLKHYCEKIIDDHVEVIRTDVLNLDEVEQYDKIIISPGPGLPKDSPILDAFLNRYKSTKSILGVCLGMQAIAEHFGHRLINLPNVLHGVQHPCLLRLNNPLFQELPEKIMVGHYHSWVIDLNTKSYELEIIALGLNDIPMAVKHYQFDIYGIQFHPESVLTPEGLTIIKNWLNA